MIHHVPQTPEDRAQTDNACVVRGRAGKLSVGPYVIVDAGALDVAEAKAEQRSDRAVLHVGRQAPVRPPRGHCLQPVRRAPAQQIGMRRIPDTGERSQHLIVPVGRRLRPRPLRLVRRQPVHHPVAICDIVGGRRLQRRDLPCDLVGVQAIIRVQPLHILATCECVTEITCVIGPLHCTGGRDERPAAGAQYRLRHRRAAVGRIIVHENDFDVRMGLRQHGLQRRTQHVSRVEARHHDGHERLRHLRPVGCTTPRMITRCPQTADGGLPWRAR